MASAFTKLMARRPEDFPHHPDTEKGWYNCILWQAKGALSHLYESKTIREKHHKLAMDERLREGICVNRCNIDGKVHKTAAFETLLQLCSNAGIRPKITKHIYWKRWNNVNKFTSMPINDFIQL